MNERRVRFRKKPYRAPRDRGRTALVLREISDLVARRRYADALGRANEELALGASAQEKARIVSLVGDSEFKRGAFDRAAEIYLQAATLTQAHHDLWLRPLVGHIRALLKDIRLDDAVRMARHAIEVAKQKWAGFEAQVRAANRRVANGDSVEVPLPPPRVSVVATRLGYLFLNDGELVAAKEFFDAALDSNPKGACRARQGLAQIALASDEPVKAAQLAAQSIRVGEYGVKTLSAWPILISAHRKMGAQRIGEGLLAGLQTARASARVRATLIIVQELRKSSMPQWRQIADAWAAREGASFPAAMAEIRKLQLSSVMAEPGVAAGKRAAAERLLAVSGLSRDEWLSAARERVRATLWDKQVIDLDGLIHKGVGLYGEDSRAVVTHGLALACMMAKRHDLARSLLGRIVAIEDPDNEDWRKALWAFARMESALGCHTEAAVLYRRYYENGTGPLRFRLQARLLWVQSLLESGATADLLRVRVEMEAALAETNDPEIILNFARQLQFGPPELGEWGRELYESGAVMALRHFQAAEHPSVALSILFKLTRRQVHDFGRSKEAVRLWAELDGDTRDWLWSQSGRFWEYIGLLVLAHTRTGGPSDVEAFVSRWLDDPATPADGVALVSIPYGLHLVLAGRMKDALRVFSAAIEAAPCHPIVSDGYYWLALAAYRQGKIAEAKRLATALRGAQGVRVGPLSEWELDAKAILLLADLHVDRVDPQAVNYTSVMLASMKEQILKDLTLL